MNNSDFKTYLSSDIPKSLFKSLVVPRPISWISTVSADGIHNIAPFSYFNIVADQPCTVMFSVTGKHTEDKGYKDTLQNILETKNFVINIVTRSLFDKMNLTAQELSRNTDEFVYADLAWIKSDNSEVRRVALSPVQLECEYYSKVLLPTDNDSLSNIMVIGVVKAVHINHSILQEDGRVNYDKMNLVARMGYDKYLHVTSNEFFIRDRTNPI